MEIPQIYTIRGDLMARGGLIVLIILGVVILSTILTSVVVFVEEELGLMDGTGRVALIRLDGEIMPAAEQTLFGPTAGLTAERVKADIERAETLRVDAIIFEVNSPGGTVLATKEIGEEIKKVEVPKIAVVKELAASGGYWIASTTDYIIADEMSILGSIGVLLGSPVEISGLMEKYGINYTQITAGKYKDAGTPLRPMTEEEKTLLQQKTDLIHEQFKIEIMENRGMTYEQVSQVSEGLFYLGIESVDNGLIDQIGNQETAEELLKEKLNVSEIKIIEMEQEPTLLEALSGGVSMGFFQMGKGIGTALKEVKTSVNKIEVFT